MSLSDCDISRINQQNASHSTGPRTDEGKARSCRNALKHGLRARKLALPNEDPEELAARAEAFHAHYNPQNPTEEVLFQEAVQAAITLDRCAQFQAATLSEQVRAAVPRVKGRIDEIQQFCDLLATDRDAGVKGLRQSAAGCAYMIGAFTALRDQIKRDGTCEKALRERCCQLGVAIHRDLTTPADFPKKADAILGVFMQCDRLLAELTPREAALRAETKAVEPVEEVAEPTNEAVEARAMLFEDPIDAALFQRYHGAALSTFFKTTKALDRALKERPEPPAMVFEMNDEARAILRAALRLPNEPEAAEESPSSPCAEPTSVDPPAPAPGPAPVSGPSPKGGTKSLEEWLDSNYEYLDISAAKKSSQIARRDANPRKKL